MDINGHDEIIIVSGLPRSGTSLMMQMLDRGGIPVVTDGRRSADVDNPRGYYEYEAVKRVKRDASWLPSIRGRAVKAVSQLLYDFPATERYRIIFMERDMVEMLRSQEKMLGRLGRAAAPTDQIEESYRIHLERLFAWLDEQPHMRRLVVQYNALMADPRSEAARIDAFLHGGLDLQKMVAAVDPSLYRNRARA